MDSFHMILLAFLVVFGTPMVLALMVRLCGDPFEEWKRNKREKKEKLCDVTVFKGPKGVAIVEGDLKQPVPNRRALVAHSRKINDV